MAPQLKNMRVKQSSKLQSLNAGLRAAQNNAALLLEKAARMNGAAVRKAFEEGVARMEETLTASRRIAWLSLAASAVASWRRSAPSSRT